MCLRRTSQPHIREHRTQVKKVMLSTIILTMPLPICAGCAKSRFLCKDCQTRLDTGIVNVLDVEASRVFHELFGIEGNLIKAVDTENQAIILVKSTDVGRVIGKGGANIKTLSERLKRHVKIVGDGSFKEMAEALLAPARVRGINEVFQPDGGKTIRVRIDSSDRDRLRMGLDDMRKLMSAATKERVELAFD
ncbi:MAG: KH domain-containing protein [Candidatus Altiarchaeota archaeon]